MTLKAKNRNPRPSGRGSPTEHRRTRAILRRLDVAVGDLRKIAGFMFSPFASLRGWHSSPSRRGGTGFSARENRKFCFPSGFTPHHQTPVMVWGFTIVELIVAIFVLAVGILAILGMFPLGIKMINSSKMETIATQLGQEKMEEINALSYEDITVGETSEPELNPPFQQYGRETRITYVDPSSGLQEVGDDKGVKKAEVTVSWKPYLTMSFKNIKFITIISKK